MQKNNAAKRLHHDLYFKVGASTDTVGVFFQNRLDFILYKFLGLNRRESNEIFGIENISYFRFVHF